jgi:hypothetical protein
MFYVDSLYKLIFIFYFKFILIIFIEIAQALLVTFQMNNVLVKKNLNALSYAICDSRFFFLRRKTL